MFTTMIVAICAISADGDAAPSNPPANSKFDVRRAVQWIFGKRPQPKEASSVAPSGGKNDDLSDSRIEMRCRTSVFSDPSLRATGMTVKVISGVAYLEGVANSRVQRLRAEQLAQKTPGVVRVENQLRLNDDSNSTSLSTASDPRAPVATEATDMHVETVSVVSPQPINVVASRPKSLPTEVGEPSVTTYSIRRNQSAGAELQNASSRTAPTGKGSPGKLVPWNDGASKQTSFGLFETLGLSTTTQVERVNKAAKKSVDPLDLAIQGILNSSASANDLTFERTGGNVVLKGAAPATAKLKAAQEIGRIPGISTVGIDSGSSGRKSTQIPRTSAIE